jgi:type II secretory ATPase GspE/PulE/Tfp pilus assembly ATPase PilB-like protein
MKKPQRLGEMLIQDQLISLSQLTEALNFQKADARRLGEILLDKGWIDDDRLTKSLAEMFQIPYRKIEAGDISVAALEKISRELMEIHQILPLSIEDRQLTVATNDPLNLPALQEIEYKTGLVIVPVMVSRKDLQGCFREIMARKPAPVSADMDQSLPVRGESAAKFVEGVIRQAIRERASDIHWEPGEDGLRVRFRIDGILYDKQKFNKKLERNMISRIKILCGMDIAESRRPQDGRMTISADQEEYELRASTLPNIVGENMVLRVLSKNFSGQDFSALGMSEHDINLMKSMIQKPHGLILVTGPTGSGKTTTLYSALNQLNERSRNIISVEDPVEYELKGISQTMVNRQLGYTFASAMKNILRHDPDIIMVGEIRDKETAEMAVQAALTGHLVLSTIHTNTAAGAVTRLVEMDIEPFLIGSALNGVIAQRLVRRLCPDCKEEYKPDAGTLAIVRQALPEAAAVSLARPAGCPACLGTGYQGREAIFEVLGINESIRELILERARESELVRQGRQAGMSNLRQAGMRKAIRGETSVEEIVRVTTTDE